MFTLASDYHPIAPDYSPNAHVNTAIQWLLSYGYPVLPIAPRNEQVVFKGKLLYSGKNPSYLDRHARATLVNQTQFQYRLPRHDELKRWFEHPATGVATLGGWQNTVWIDIDRKHFGSAEACTAVVRQLLQQYPALQSTVIERTQSGGYHIGVRCRHLPTFTRCCLAATQQPLGELIGAGKVCVMAPTQGVDGHYQSLQRTTPVWIDSVTDLGLVPRQAPRPLLPVWRDASSQSCTTSLGTVDLRRLLSQRIRLLLVDQPDDGARSDWLTAVAREAFGWEWFAAQQGVRVYPDAEPFCFAVGQQWQLDVGRVQRVLDSTSYGRPVRDSTPGLYAVAGLNACLGKLRWASRKQYRH